MDEVKKVTTAGSSFSNGKAEAPGKPFLAVKNRRGGFLNLEQPQSPGLLPESYFFEGRAKLRQILGPLPAVIYSNGFETAKAVAGRIEHSLPHHATVGKPTLQAAGSFSSASGFCISNSLFGWWGAYVCETQSVVIAPRPWFANPRVQTRDLLESSWHSRILPRQNCFAPGIGNPPLKIRGCGETNLKRRPQQVHRDLPLRSE